jgi:hypothetical protein
VFALLDNDETVVAYRSRVLAILALMSSTRGNKRMEFVNRDFSVAINIRTCALLYTSPEKLAQFLLRGTTSQARSVQGETETDSTRPVKKDREVSACGY